MLQYAARLQATAVATKQAPPENMLTCLAELFVQASCRSRTQPDADCGTALCGLGPALLRHRPSTCQQAHVSLPLAALCSAPQVSSQKKKCGFVSPRRFVGRVKAENALFSSYMHQASWRALRTVRCLLAGAGWHL